MYTYSELKKKLTKLTDKEITMMVDWCNQQPYVAGDLLPNWERHGSFCGIVHGESSHRIMNRGK